jgi:hypothetical protein
MSEPITEAELVEMEEWLRTYPHARMPTRDALNLIAEVCRLRHLLEDCAYQFSFAAGGDGQSCTTGGLAIWETVFKALGWDDPHPIGGAGR